MPTHDTIDPPDDAGMIRLQPGQVAPTVVAALAGDWVAALAAWHGQGRILGALIPAALRVSSDLSRGTIVAEGRDDTAAQPYLAPETSGRLAHGADLRADIYALGVVLYELATGVRPFAAADAGAMLHRHLTHVPPAAHSVSPAVPGPLSDLIARMMAKDPDARPQSAAEVQAALNGSATPRLDLPDMVYGQDEPLGQVAAQVRAALAGQGARLVCVRGPSGSGKSTLITQLAKTALPPEVRVVQGKFDQLDRTQPYSAVLAAFDMALRQILSGSADAVEMWRNRLQDALSPNAQVLLDILPRYLALIGPQPPVPALGLNEGQIRVSLVFRRFLGALARADAPMVLVLDDLQWADAASLGLIRLVLSDSGLQNLVVLTAYRDNEVGPDHPVQRLLDEAAGLSPPVQVRALRADEVTHLVADCLGAATDDIAPLAAIIARKTAGNPYFIRQFLLALVRTGRIFQGPVMGQWRWDADGALAERFTENVVDLVAERILALSGPVQDLLRVASCIGSVFDVALLAQTVGREVAGDLETAVRADVLGQAERAADGRVVTYQFLHDRVQQAANAMLDTASRSRLHARLGILMLDRAAGEDGQGNQITDHLIAGMADLDPELRLRLRDLALQSATRSMGSNAYEAAQRYYLAAARTLPGAPWETDPALAFRVDLGCAKIAYLLGRIPEAEARAADLLTRNLAVLDRVAVLEVMILLHNSEVRYLKALEVGAQALSLLRAPLPRAPSMVRVLGAFALTKFAGRKFSDDQIFDLPVLTDPRHLAIMRVMVLLCPPAYFTSSTLLPLIALRLVRMSLRHGNSPDSAYAYAIYGMLHGLVLGNPLRAGEFAEMSVRLIPKLGAESSAGRILMMYGGFIKHLAAPLAASLVIYDDAIDRSLSGGDVETHGYTRYGHGSYALMAGQPLVQVTEGMERHLAAVTVVRHEKTRRIMTMALNSLYRMQGRVFPEPFDEAENTAVWTAGADATSLAYLHKYKMLEALMRGDYAQVHVEAQGMKANERGILSMAFQPYYLFYRALAMIHLSGGQSLPRRVVLRARAALLQRQLQRAARFAPETHAHRAVLLAADMAAARGRTAQALAGFERGVALARQVGSLHDLALGYERAGLFLVSAGAREQAAGMLQKAVDAYLDWGGREWAVALIARHPGLGLALRGQAQATSMDSAALIKAAAAIAEKTSAADMADEILRVMVQNAGATRGVLLLPDDGVLRVAASHPAGRAAQFPQSIVNLVQRSGERLVLADARTAADFAQDPHIALAQPQSVLCAPLVARGVVMGVAYLENPHLRGAFTTDRADLVEVLGAQAAIALENARLLTRMQGLLERQVDMTSAHARFVPHTFLDLLGRPSILDVRLGDHVRAQSAILFADIRGFTPLIEAMPPDEVMEFVNGFLSRMEPPVRASAGFIDSIVGDAVMAVFDRGAEAGVIAGIAMLRALQDWQDRAGLAVQIGIGVATGELIFGTIGAANRLKCGVLGDTVNLAARIEGLTRHYGVGFLITDTTRDALPDPARFALREVDLVEVVGRKAAVGLYEVFDADPDVLRDQKARTAPDLAAGLARYRAGDLAGAAAAFDRAVAGAPEDPVAAMLRARCAAAGPAPGPDWTGVARMHKK